MTREVNNLSHLAADNCRRSAWREKEVYCTVGVQRDGRPQTADRTTPEAGKRKARQDWIGLDWTGVDRSVTGLWIGGYGGRRGRIVGCVSWGVATTRQHNAKSWAWTCCSE
jgi:hypothetical protein